jgi:hypothetical protein
VLCNLDDRNQLEARILLSVSGLLVQLHITLYVSSVHTLLCDFFICENNIPHSLAYYENKP